MASESKYRVVECVDGGTVQEVEDVHAGQKLIGELFKKEIGHLRSIRYMTALFCLEEFIVDAESPEGEWHCACSQLED